MHSKDRTLLAQMGFADPDRKETRHELAIQYLIRRDVAFAMTCIAIDASEGLINFQVYDGGEPTLLRECEIERIASVATEVHVGKGDGKFKGTVGFLDIVFDVAVRKKVVPKEADPMSCRAVNYSQVVEVKINPIPTSDLIRQINLYREYHSAKIWIAALAYSISEDDANLLRIARIRHVRLGDKFTQYVQSRKTDRRESDTPEV